MGKHYYHTYGMTVSSEIAFFEMNEIEPTTKVDANIIIGTPPAWVMEEYKQGRFSSIKEQIMWFRLYDDLLIYVENGNLAIVWPINPNIAESTLHTYTLSGVFTFLLLQREYLCVHGSALAYQGKAFIISGPSGSGKSTTALELLKKKEIQFLSDDICPLKKADNSMLLFPGPPWQKVCTDVKEKETGFDYAYMEISGGKYGRHLQDKYAGFPCPMGAMVIICKSDCLEVSIEELQGTHKLDAFTHNLFRGELLNFLGITPKRMLQFLETINSFPIYRLCRPQNADTLSTVTSLIFDTIIKK